MSRCYDCLHYKVCGYRIDEEGITTAGCTQFADRSEWIHLPCKVGDKIWYIKNGKVNFRLVSKSSIYSIATSGKIGKTAFITCEEAEKALEEKK